MTVDENSPTEALWLEELGKGYHVFVKSYVLASFCKHVEVMFGVILKSCLGNVWNPFENLTSKLTFSDNLSCLFSEDFGSQKLDPF